MTTSENEPLGHVDAGEDLFIIIDADGRGLSYHRTADGAEKRLPHTTGATGIQKNTLHY